MRETVYEHESITVYFHPADGIVHHEVHQAVRGEAFREALSHGAALMERHPATKWLSDDRNYFILPEDDEEWARTVWFPRVKAAGWRHWAVVRPERSLGELNVSRFIKMYEGLGINANLVTDFDTAWDWIVSQ